MEEILFHKGLERRESIGLILKGIGVGTVVGTGLTVASGFVSPALSAVVATAAAIGSGFVTTYMLQRAAKTKKK